MAPAQGRPAEGFYGVRNVKAFDDLINNRSPKDRSTEVMPAETPVGRGDETSPADRRAGRDSEGCPTSPPRG
jgi:hypothetical protein